MNEFVHCPICSLTNYPYFCPQKKMQLFYHPTVNPESENVLFDKEESTHIHKVLRKKTGDLLSITDGKGHLYHAYIQEIGDKKCLAHIQSCELMPAAAYHLHMVVAPTKMNERYEWFLEKAMEIGLQEITPIICEHSERKVVKIERFEKLLLSAMKQSLQYYLPKLNPAISLLEWLDQAPGDAQYIAHCQEGNRQSLFEQISTLPDKVKNITILIGPEGDFSEKEIQKALEKGFIPVVLSPHRLRTETAAVVACSSVANAFSEKK